MPKFFRNLRIKSIELSKVKNYLLYAVGEIILVVIGIALAVQFNDWKEDRTKRKQLAEHYENIVLNLEADSLDLMRVSHSIDKSLKSAEALITQIYTEITDDTEAQANLSQLLYEYSFNPVKTGAQGLNISGLIGIVKPDIRRGLLKLDWLYTQIENIEVNSNNYISTKYEAHFYDNYVDVYNAKNDDPILKSIILEDKRHHPTINRMKFLNDRKLEVHIITRIYHLRQLKTLYSQARTLTTELKTKLIKE
ncbi:MAG: hypothetical protein ACKO96_49505, partial [Flammeovirgaceae bacterium]